MAKKNKLNSDFHKKYYKFIQEGTWTSNDYFDPDLYYQAANMVLYTSSFPQTSYTINVLELSQLEGYEPYTFKIADKTYIEDTEFFGYDYKNRPYKEEIVVSEVKYNLDDPTQNTITVQNYKTQFQDLFQRIAATSQSLQYNEGLYNRAASAITDNGSIQPALLQNSLKDNELIIQNAKNQSVSWDETGITISNFVNANELVRLTSGGIVLSKDGGQTWTTGISGSGINAEVITTGRLDTDRIRIFNGNMQQTFEWNSTGINAYMQGGNYFYRPDSSAPWEDVTLSSTEVNYGKFVRFDQYGLYGYSGGIPNWQPASVDEVISNSSFSLTWKGLSINVPSSQATEDVININNGNFKVDKYGNVSLRGSITWNTDNTPTKVLYSENSIPKPTLAYSDYESASTTDWHKTLNVSDDEYASYSYDGGQSWTDAIKIAGTDGTNGAQGPAGASAPEVKTLYNITGTTKPTDGTSWDSIPSSSTTTWHKNFNSSVDRYISYSYDDGATWGPAIKFVAEDAPQVKVVYAKVILSKPTGTNFEENDNEQGRWHTTFNSSSDMSACYSYDDGANWTDPMQIVGKDAPEIRILYARVNTLTKPSNISEAEWTNNYQDEDNLSVPRWHKVFAPSTDRYAIYSYDGGKNWTDAAKIVGDDAPEMKVLYAISNIPKPTNNYSDYELTYDLGWHKTLGTNDRYASYNYNNGIAGDNGENWTTPVKIVVDDAPQIKVLYARDITNLDTPDQPYGSYEYGDNVSTPIWHKSFMYGSDKYASYSYDGGSGNDWTDAIQIVGSKGDKGDTGAKGDKGDTGTKGDKGDKGDTGATGPKGDKATLMLILYAQTKLSTLPSGYNYPDADTNGWHKIVTDNDIYPSYSCDNGNTWTNPVKIVGSDATVTKRNIFDILTYNEIIGQRNQGLFYEASGDPEYDGLYINAQYIKAGTIDASVIEVTNLDASNITAGTLDADKITAGTLKVTEIFDSNGARITGSPTSNIIQPDFLNLKGIEIKKGTTTTFKVATDGTVTINGNVTMGANSTIAWDSVDETGTSPYATTGALSTVSTTASSAASTANTAKSTADTAKSTADSAASAASTASSNVSKLANGTYSGGTFISKKTIYSPTIYANSFNVYAPSQGNSNSHNGFYLYDYDAEAAALAIDYYDGTAPTIFFYSPWSGYADWNFGSTTVRGNIDFSHATVTGLSTSSGTAKAVFGS